MKMALVQKYWCPERAVRTEKGRKLKVKKKFMQNAEANGNAKQLTGVPRSWNPGNFVS